MDPRRIQPRPSHLPALALCAALLLGGCPRPRPRDEGQARHPAPGGGVLRIRMPADLPKLPCALQGHRWCNRVLQDSVYEPLVRWSPRHERYEPVLATRWKRLEKGRVFQVTLRKEVRWHNGKPFKAEDVKHTLEQLRTGGAATPAARLIKAQVERVRYATDHQLEIHFRKPFGPVLALLSSIPILPSPKTLGTRTGEQLPVVGTGPFRFIQWWPQEKIVLARFPGYWGPPSRLDRVEFHVVPSWTEVAARLRQGKLDLVLDLDTASYRQVRSALPKARPVTLEPAGFAAISFNTRRAPLNDQRVRQALWHLIDRSKLVSALPGVRPHLLDAPIWRHGPQRRAALGTSPTLDPKLAARLLAAAGWRRAAGRWQKAGSPLTFSLLTAMRSQSINRGLRAVRDDLKRAGVTLIIRKVLWGQMVVALRNRSFDAIVLETPLQGPWSNLVDLAHSDSAAHLGNHGGLKDPTLDKLLGRILRESRDTKRLALERRAFQRLAVQAVVLPLHAPRSVGLSRWRLRDVELTVSWLNLSRLRIDKPNSH